MLLNRNRALDAPELGSVSLVLFFLTLLVSFFFASPLWRILPGRDSAAYLYVAQTLLHGGLPYRDAWDHKPPLTYLIDAVGLKLAGISGGTSWGLWALELLFGVAGGLWVRKAAAQLGGIVAENLALAAFPLLLFAFLNGGNNPEEWCVVASSAALYVLTRPARGASDYALLGLACAWMILAKLWGQGIVVWALLLLLRERNLKGLAVFGLAAAAPLAALLLWSVRAGFLASMVDAVFRYNRSYLQAMDWGARLDGLHVYLLRIGWLVAPAALLLWNTKNGNLRALCGLHLFEAAEIIWTGRRDVHYLLLILPSTCLILSLGVETALDLLRRHGPRPAARSLDPVLWIQVAGLVLLTAALLWRWPTIIDADKQNKLDFRSVFAALGPRKVLIWGAETEVLYGTDCVSVDPHFYNYPLLTKGYATPAMRAAFEDRVVNGPCDAILDAPGGVGGPLSAGSAAYRAEWAPSYDVTWVPPRIRSMLRSDFALRLSRPGWALYVRKVSGR